MTGPPDFDLISEIGADLAAGAPAGCVRLTVTVAVFDEELLVTALADTPTGRKTFALSHTAVNALLQLRHHMYRPDKGTWYETIISVTPEDGTNFSFGYDELPTNASRVSEDLLVALMHKDHQRYPRDQEFLPEWHPAKVPAEPPPVHYQLADVDGEWIDDSLARAMSEEGFTIRVYSGRDSDRWVLTFGPGAYKIDFLDGHSNRTKHVIYVPRGDMLWRAVVIEYIYPDHERRWPDEDDLVGIYSGEADPATDFLRIVNTNGSKETAKQRDYTGFREEPFWQRRPEFGDWTPLIEAARAASPAAGVDHFDHRDSDHPEATANGLVYTDAQTGQPLSDVAARARFEAGHDLQISISQVNDLPGRVAILWHGPRHGATVIFHDQHENEWRRHGFHVADGRLWLAMETDSIYAGTDQHWDRTEAAYVIQRGVIPGTGADMVSFIEDPTEDKVLNTPPQFNFDGPVNPSRWVKIPTFGDWSAFTDPRGPRHTTESYALAQRATRLRAQREGQPPTTEIAPPGWGAIDNALEPLYPGVVPQHWGTIVRWKDGGNEPLDGMSAYVRSAPSPHWHYVSYGMSDLYEKRSADPAVSGWGFEFTFRLAREPGQTEAPIWPVNLLQSLGRYVFETGNIFAPGHHIDTNGPIASDEPICTSRALAFTEDPELGTIDTPNGKVQFLQAVGLTIDEYEAAVSWNTTKLLQLFTDRIPLLVTDTERETQLSDPVLRQIISDGIERDGSSRSFLRVELVNWHSVDGFTLQFNEYVADEIARTLRSRLPYGNTLLVSSPERSVLFKPAETYAVTRNADQVEIGLPLDALANIAEALRTPGRTEVSGLPPGLIIETI